MKRDTDIGGNGYAFMSTPWTDILSVKELSSEDRLKRLDFLLERYWRPVYFFIRRKGRNNEEAKDLTQAFFAKMLEVDIVGRADPAKGRFRSYLLTSVTRFLSSREGQQAAGKTDFPKGTKFIEQMASSEFPACEPSDQLTPEREFNRQWAISLLNTIFSRLKDMCTDRDCMDTFEVFRRRFARGGAADYGANNRIAREMGISVRQVEGHYKKALRWYRFLLREEVAAYVEKQSEIEEEIRDLWRMLGRG
ncbi:MAG: hypothetical protein E3J72_03140 [Planctomycetota bacterium]|nr:MAG: hypothetical protein E3J72_03140 [Planctomycetota bacterium]